MGQEKGKNSIHNILMKHLEANPPDPRNAGKENAPSRPSDKGETRRFLASLQTEGILDLHGRTVQEAEGRLSSFLDESSRMGLRKVLVIHGKGIHSRGEPVLGRAVRRMLESSPYTGEFGQASPREGGAGASWVILRKRDGKASYRSR